MPVVAQGVSAYSPAVMHRPSTIAFLPLPAATFALLLHLLRPARS
jgi:hypothetical protein